MKEALLIVMPGFPADESDTTCLPAFQQFALSLKKAAAQKEIIVLAFQYPFVEKSYQWHGIRVIALGGKNRGKFYRAITWLKAWRALKNIQTQNTVTGMVSIWVTECALIANRFSKKYTIPHVMWIIGQDAKTSNRYVGRIKPRAQQLMAMSDFLQDEFYKNHGIKAGHVIENGINADAFPPYNAGARPIAIFGAGSLIPLKNYQLFVELIAELKKSQPSIHAVIAGDGEERVVLQNKIEQLGLQKNVQLVGLKTHPETLKLMSQSKVFLHTSVYEGNSTVLMEALYSGCQVLSTQPLSHRATKHLFVDGNKDVLLKQLQALFSQPDIIQERVTFNTMDRSAKRILELLAG